MAASNLVTHADVSFHVRAAVGWRPSSQMITFASKCCKVRWALNSNTKLLTGVEDRTAHLVRMHSARYESSECGVTGDEKHMGDYLKKLRVNVEQEKDDGLDPRPVSVSRLGDQWV